MNYRRIAAALAVFLLLVLTSCGNDPLSPSLTVRYQVTGSADQVNIDYIDEAGNLAIINSESVPWEITFSMAQGEQAFVSAKRVGETGTVTVKIYSNGTLVGEDSSSDGSAAEVDVTL